MRMSVLVILPSSEASRHRLAFEVDQCSAGGGDRSAGSLPCTHDLALVVALAGTVVSRVLPSRVHGPG